MKTDRCFKSTNFSLATFLYAKDQQIGGVNPTGNNTVRSFAFIQTPTLEELIYLYKYGNREDDRLLVEVHKYEQARRELLDRLRD